MFRPLMIGLTALSLAAPAAAQPRPTPKAAGAAEAWEESIKDQDGWVYLGVANAGAAVFALAEAPRGEWPIIRVWTRYEFPKDLKVEGAIMRSGLALGEYDCRGLRQRYLGEYRFPEALLAGEVQASEMQDGKDFEWIKPKPTSDEGILTARLCDALKPDKPD